MSLFDGIFGLLATFRAYAEKEGNPKQLSKKEVKQLFEEQLVGKDALTSKDVDDLLKALDQDGDAEVNFLEFFPLVAVLSNVDTKSEAPSSLLKGIQTLKKVFEKYASQEGNKNSLNKREVKDLVEKEVMENKKGKKTEIKKEELDKIFKELDEDGDSEVDFGEFLVFVAVFTAALNESF